jgi:hypothetical protein
MNTAPASKIAATAAIASVLLIAATVLSPKRFDASVCGD